MIELNLYKAKVLNILSFLIFCLLNELTIQLIYLIFLRKFLEIMGRLVSKIFLLGYSEMIIYLCCNQSDEINFDLNFLNHTVMNKVYNKILNKNM